MEVKLLLRYFHCESTKPHINRLLKRNAFYVGFGNILPKAPDVDFVTNAERHPVQYTKIIMYRNNPDGRILIFSMN